MSPKKSSNEVILALGSMRFRVKWFIFSPVFSQTKFETEKACVSFPYTSEGDLNGIENKRLIDERLLLN